MQQPARAPHGTSSSFENNMKGRMNRSELDRDEELSFFRDLRNRGQNEHIPSLLLCPSQEYESDTNGGTTGRFSLYRIASGRKEHGIEFLETNKSDFNWLKTPPATPLFPSLEMEPSAQLVTQKEIPISQPISQVQFAKSDVEALKPKPTHGIANNTNSTKTSKLANRSTTPSNNKIRPSPLKNTNGHISNAKKQHDASSNTKNSTPQKQTNNNDFHALINPKKSIEANESQRKPRARGVSPSVNSKAADIIIQLSNETPPNLRTDERSSSSTRGRSTTRASTVVGFQNSDPTPKACRPSRSPSPSMSSVGNWNQLEGTQKNLRRQKETFTLASGSNKSRSHFKGSKMVEKVVNARKSGISQADRTDTKTCQI